MASKGGSKHIKSIASPPYFGVYKKGAGKYTAKPNPGRHVLSKCVAVLLFLKQMKMAATLREANRILREGNVSVNGKPIRTPRYPIGINDILGIKGAGKVYRVGIDKTGKVKFEETSEREAKTVLKIVGKYKTDGGVIMVRLHDGSIVKGDNAMKLNSSVVLDKERAISEVIPLEEGAKCMVVDGVHVGAVGVIKEIRPGTMHNGPSAKIESSGGAFNTLLKNIMVVP
jgi:small subunit ribosomal protein S4e